MAVDLASEALSMQATCDQLLRLSQLSDDLSVWNRRTAVAHLRPTGWRSGSPSNAPWR